MENFPVCPSRYKSLEIGCSVYKSIHDFGLTPQDLEKAFQELNEKEEERKACIIKLKEKLKTDSKYRFLDDDEYLLSYLRYRKFDIDRAFNTLCKAYSMRIKHSELFFLPTNLESIYDMGILNLLPYRDEKGRLLYWVKFGKWNTEDVSLYEILQAVFAMLDLAFMNPCCQIHGVAGIWDFKGFNPTAKSVASALNPRLIWTLSTLWQDCLPQRIKLVILINCRSWVRKLFNGIKLCIRSKLVQRIYLFDTGATALPQFFNPAILPKELGGMMIEDDECIITGHVKENMPYLKYMRSLETAEST